MLITSSDVVLNIVLKKIRAKYSDRKFFQNIEVCMEEGHILLLKNLDTIYGNLYDM